MEYSNIFSQLTLNPSTFSMMLAPTGWGKTTLVLELAKKQKIVFISPLRIIAQEFEERAKKQINTFSTCDQSTTDVLNKFLKSKSGILVTTAEKIHEYLDCFLLQEILFVLDEIHLFWHWGERFRPVLNEVLMGICAHGFRLLGLSATVDEKILKEKIIPYRNEYASFVLLDLYKNSSEKKICKNVGLKSLGRGAFIALVYREMMKNSGNAIFFVKSRLEVDFYTRYFSQKKIKVIGCKGGEVDKFYLKLKTMEGPYLIVSTTALSHGANLPVIKKVFINYKVEENDFFKQMKGRGGRDNKGFDFFHCNDLSIGFKESLKLGVINVLLKVRLNWLIYENKNRGYSFIKDALSRKACRRKVVASKWQAYIYCFFWWTRWRE